MRSIALKPRRKVNPNIRLFTGTKKNTKLSVTKEKQKAWTVFSQYIRLRDCLETTGTLHMGKCCTCGKIISYKESQAGHFIPGRGGAILFLENNVHLQCAGCNIYRHGNVVEYLEFMRNKYGQEVLNELIAKRHETHRWKVCELQEIREKYQQKVLQFTNLIKEVNS